MKTAILVEEIILLFLPFLSQNCFCHDTVLGHQADKMSITNNDPTMYILFGLSLLGVSRLVKIKFKNLSSLSKLLRGQRWSKYIEDSLIKNHN